MTGLLRAPRVVVAVGAHPDDVEYGCLGYLLKLKARGAEVHVYVASLGSKGDATASAARGQETRAALAVLEPATLTVRDKTGLDGDDYVEVAEEIASLVDRVRADLVITLSRYDTHQEHRLVHEATVTACRRSPASLLCYGILSNTPDFVPRLFVDVEDVYEEKMRALRAHASQGDKSYMRPALVEAFHTRTFAMLRGLRRCEAFEVAYWIER